MAEWSGLSCRPSVIGHRPFAPCAEVPPAQLVDVFMGQPGGSGEAILARQGQDQRDRTFQVAAVARRDEQGIDAVLRAQDAADRLAVLA